VACPTQKIGEANANGDRNTIYLTGTYALTGQNALPSVTSALTIQGTGAGSTAIQRDDANAPPFRILHVAPQGALWLDGVTIRGGYCPTGRRPQK
jgi:hypothetical protein